MTLREANAEAVRRFGSGSYCETRRSGGRTTRRLVIRRRVSGRRLCLVFNYPGSADWRKILKALTPYFSAGFETERT